MGPLWVGVLAYYILKEPYQKKEFAGAVVSIIGLVLIVRPPFIFGEHKSTDIVIYHIYN